MEPRLSGLLIYYNRMAKPSFWHQLWRGKTPVRALMNSALAGLPLFSGRILDIGGTKQPLPSYRSAFAVAEGSQIIALNIDLGSAPDIAGDAARLPFPDACFDHAWCLNVLEHLPEPERVFGEVQRILKPGGRFVAFTPFFVRIHGHPEDYARYTDTALRRFAERAGFKDARIQPVGFGPWTVGCSQIVTGWPRILAFVAYACAIGLDRLFFPKKNVSVWPLGYLLIVKTCAEKD